MNKIGFKKRTVCAVLVSVICILLASSFVFHISVEALTYDYDLQTMYFQAAVDRNGEPLSPVDTSLIVQQSVTDNNAFAEGTMQKVGFTAPSGWLQQDYVEDGYFLKDSSTGDVSLVSPYQTKTYLSNGLFIGFASLDLCFKKDSGYGNYYIYNSNDDLVYTRQNGYYWSCLGLYELNGYYYVFYSRRATSSGTSYYGVELIDKSTLQYVSYYSSVVEAYSAVYVISGKFYILKSDGVYIWDGLSAFPSSPSAALPSGVSSITWTIIRRVDNTLWLIGTVDGYTNFYYLSENGFELSFSVSSVGTISNSYFCAFVGGAWLIHSSSSDVILSEYPDFSYDFSQYVGNSFTPSRWLNFSLRNDATGAFTGGYHVGIELDFGVSPLMFNQVALKGFSVGVTSLIASDYMISSETTMSAPRPLNVWIGTDYVTSYDTQYDYIGQRDGKYLYMCSSVCNFSTQGRLNAVKIVVNCYIPYQVSSHSFSLPISIFSMTDEYSGGGGGESSGGGSSGGESSGTPSVDPGESSDDVPGENDPAFLKIYKVSSGGTLSYIRYFPTAQLSKVSVFFGSLPSFEYSRQGTYGISPSSSFLVLEYVDSGQRIIDLDFYAQGWSKTPSLSSMHYPLFSGNVIEIDFSNTYSIYLADVVPYGQIRICDYATYSLVNLPAPDSVVNISQYSDTQFQVSCQGSVRYYPGKIARYKEYGFGSSTPWQLYEEGAVLQFSRLGSPLLNTVQLQTYTGEFPPHDPDYEEQIRIEESIRAELESRANEIYGSVSFDPQDESDFDEAKQDVTDVLGSGSVFFNFVNKLWNTNPFTSHFVVITATCAILAFIVRKL